MVGFAVPSFSWLYNEVEVSTGIYTTECRRHEVVYTTGL